MIRSISRFLVIYIAMASLAAAQTFTTLYIFNSGDNQPSALIEGADGNFYGTTHYGGINNAGTVFKITPSGTLTNLHEFCAQSGCPDGTQPLAALVESRDGNFYGTTSAGGVYRGGTIFKIDPQGVLTTIYDFCAHAQCADGQFPATVLVKGTEGDLYGTTASGGAYGKGTVFKIAPAGVLTTLYDFCAQIACTDGESPNGLLQATDGNFYGTTYSGTNLGTVFQMTPAGGLTTLHSFCAQTGCTDGYYPLGGLIQASDGNFYGTTSAGGEFLGGTVFRITAAGELTTLYTFPHSPSGYTHGNEPVGTLTQAADGSLYGTTIKGGGDGERGTIFRLSPEGTFTTVCGFGSPVCPTGGNPRAGLLQAADGTLYGTTSDEVFRRHSTSISLESPTRTRLPYLQPRLADCSR